MLDSVISQLVVSHASFLRPVVSLLEFIFKRKWPALFYDL